MLKPNNPPTCSFGQSHIGTLISRILILPDVTIHHRKNPREELTVRPSLSHQVKVSSKERTTTTRRTKKVDESVVVVVVVVE
jgi:hypothetical protein